MNSATQPKRKGGDMERAEYTNIARLLQTHKRRRHPNYPTIEIFTTFKSLHNVHQFTVQGMVFGVKISRNASGIPVSTICIGDHTGVMSIDLHRIRDRVIWKELISVRTGAFITITGRPVARADFPTFLTQCVVSVEQPPVLQLQKLARSLKIPHIPNVRKLNKSQLMHAIVATQQQRYCEKPFISGQGNNHFYCSHA